MLFIKTLLYSLIFCKFSVHCLKSLSYSLSVMSSCSIFSSINPNQPINHQNINVNSFYIPCLSINDFLSSFNFDAIDRFYIDVEGSDVPILLDLDFYKFKIAYIEFEFIHSDGTWNRGQNFIKLLEKLMNFGYTLSKRSEYNIVATK